MPLSTWSSAGQICTMSIIRNPHTFGFPPKKMKYDEGTSLGKKAHCHYIRPLYQQYIPAKPDVESDNCTSDNESQVTKDPPQGTSCTPALSSTETLTYEMENTYESLSRCDLDLLVPPKPSTWSGNQLLSTDQQPRLFSNTEDSASLLSDKLNTSTT